MVDLLVTGVMAWAPVGTAIIGANAWLAEIGLHPRREYVEGLDKHVGRDRM